MLKGLKEKICSRENFNFSKILIVSLILISILVSSIGYAAPQDDLDSKGMVIMTADGSILLRAGETYYLALRGGNGGKGGDAVSWNSISDHNAETGRYGSSGNAGVSIVNYYKIEVENDTTIILYKGNHGQSGNDAPFKWVKDQWTAGREIGTSLAGGNGGKNTLAMGSGNSGTSGTTYYKYHQHSNWSEVLCYGAPSGGGGGAASIITFSGNTDYRIVANGGRGGDGGLTHFVYGHMDGPVQFDPSTPSGKSGVGGAVSENYNNIPGVKVTKLTGPDGKVNTPTSPGAIIRKQRKNTGEAIPVSNVMMGEHIILSNSVNGETTVFQKTTNDYEFKYAGGYNQIQFYDFSKYVVSGSGANGTLIIRTKQDLSFVGGDGSLAFPYYPEVAGSNTSGNSGNNLITSQGSYNPFAVIARTANGTTATKNDSVEVVLNVTGQKLSDFTYSVKLNNSLVNEFITLPADNILAVNGLNKGYNTILITVQDGEGNTQTEVINIWRLGV